MSLSDITKQVLPNGAWETTVQRGFPGSNTHTCGGGFRTVMQAARVQNSIELCLWNSGLGHRWAFNILVTPSILLSILTCTNQLDKLMESGSKQSKKILDRRAVLSMQTQEAPPLHFLLLTSPARLNHTSWTELGAIIQAKMPARGTP